MAKNGNFEIPEQMRELAGQSVSKAEEAYNGFVEAAKKAQTLVSESSETMNSGAKELQEKALSFASENMQANFELATRLVQAKDLQEALEIQNEFAKKQMEAYSEQAQSMTKMLSDVVQKAQPKS